MSGTPIKITLERTKETKGTTVFTSSDPHAAVSPLYVKKPTFEAVRKIEITITEVE